MAHHIDVPLSLPLVDGSAQWVGARCDSRVVAQEVDRAMAVLDAVQRGGQGFSVAHVHSFSKPTDCVGNVGGLFGRPVDHDNGAGAVGGEPLA